MRLSTIAVRPPMQRSVSAVRWERVDRQRCDVHGGPGAAGLLLPFAACNAAPSVNVLGSFFPAWLICIVSGVVLTVLARQLFVTTKVASQLRPVALVYPCLAALFALATWLVVFGS